MPSRSTGPGRLGRCFQRRVSDVAQSAKRDVDLRRLPAMCGAMASEVDNDALELSRTLCTRAGMLLEDASAKVILIGDLEQEQLRSAIWDARTMIGQADALLAAAETIIASGLST